MLTVFIIGPAGSGKSTLTASFSKWLTANDIPVVTVNLDPAVEWLPYDPDVDVRNYLTAQDLMKKYNLGPNGAIIAATDLLATEVLYTIKDEIKSYKTGYVLIDTPGQMEIFAFRTVGTYLVNELAEERSAILFLIDSVFALSPSTFISSLMLSVSVFYRFSRPQIVVLTKCDLLDEKDIEKAETWISSPEALLVEFAKEKTPSQHFNEKICELIADIVESFKIVPVSSATGEGLDKLYILLQQIYTGGEDYITLP